MNFRSGYHGSAGNNQHQMQGGRVKVFSFTAFDLSLMGTLD
jgi:hypothetical protein